MLENENVALRQEVRRLQRIMADSHELKTHSRSVSNASSTNEEDYGYTSGRNTLDIRRASPHPYEGDAGGAGGGSAGRGSHRSGGGSVGSNYSVSSTIVASHGESRREEKRHPFVDYERVYRTPPDAIGMLKGENAGGRPLWWNWWYRLEAAANPY